MLYLCTLKATYIAKVNDINHRIYIHALKMLYTYNKNVIYFIENLIISLAWQYAPWPMATFLCLKFVRLIYHSLPLFDIDMDLNAYI